MVPNDYPLPGIRARLMEVEMSIRSLRFAFRVRYSLRVEDIHSGMTISIGGDDAYADVGMSPVALCLYAFDQAAESRVDLNREIEYLPEDRTAGMGPLQAATFGSRYTVEQLCRYAVLENDGIARRMLNRSLGESAVTQWLRTLYECQERTGLEGTSPADTVALLRHLLSLVERQPLLGGTLLEWMIHAGRTGLATLLPDGVRVAHNLVTTARTVADAGIVFLPKAPYLISIMTDSSQAPSLEAAQEHVVQVSKRVYDHLAAMAGSLVGVHVGGERLVASRPVCLYRGEPVGPVAETAKALGVDVETNAITQAMTLRRAGAMVTITPGDVRMQCKSDTRTLPVAPFLFEGICHAPLIPVFTALGVHVDWDAGCNRMALSTGASN